MKKIKKILIILLILVILVGAAGGGLYAYQKHQEDSLQAEVYYVSDLNWGYYEENMTSSGYISNDFVQNVYAEEGTISEVCVEVGDKVKTGDTLFIYDTSDEEMQLELLELELQGVKNSIDRSQREIDRLKKITPVSENQKEEKESEKESEEKEEKKQTTTIVMVEPQEKAGDAYNFINKKSKPYEGDGSAANPYRFLCTPECYVLGSYLNKLVEKELVATFEIWSGNDRTEGTLLNYWIVDGTTFSKVEEDSKWHVATQEQLEDEVIIEEEEESEEPESEEPESEEPETDEEYYTADELKESIKEEEDSIKEQKVEQKELELEIEELNNKKEKSTVAAKIDGVVKHVGDMEDPSVDGMPFIEITDAKGLYVTGDISELRLNDIEVGQEIYVNSWSTGGEYVATITEISKYPSENGDWYYGGGNTNVSYYPFTAYIEDPEGLQDGDYVDLSIAPLSASEDMSIIVLEKAYVREENGMSYVYKVGPDERLVKQYVQTGRTVYGSAVEIKAGLTGEDRIAFPYGKTAKEGVKAVEAAEFYY